MNDKKSIIRTESHMIQNKMCVRNKGTPGTSGRPLTSEQDGQMSISEMQEELKRHLNPKRYSHSVRVMETAVELAGVHGIDENKAAIAGLLHDCMRDVKGEELRLTCEKYGISSCGVYDVDKGNARLIHSALGAEAAEEYFGVCDSEIKEAIRRHTFGCAEMSELSKIVYVADYIEPGRKLEGIEKIAAEAREDLDAAMLTILNNTILYIIQKKAPLHPDTIEARNSILNKMSKPG